MTQIKPSTAIEAMTIERRGFQKHVNQPDWLYRLARVMKIANTKPEWPDSFYPIKSAILKTWGRADGFDRQLIEYQCWGKTGYYNGYYCNPYCEKCNGTGAYDRVCIRLDRYRLGDSLFHIPNGRTLTQAKQYCDIVGRVKHQQRRTNRLAIIALGQMFHRPTYLKGLERITGNLFGRYVRRSNEICEWVAMPDQTEIHRNGCFSDLLSKEICARLNREGVPF